MIFNIPLPKEKAEGEVSWHCGKKGEYSVKSGYQLALKIKSPEPSNSSGNNSKHWNALWSLKIPKKIKIFMWRAIKNLLPSVENLWKMRILQEPICQRCNRSVETISHALLECKAANKIWIQAPFTAPTSNVQL